MEEFITSLRFVLENNKHSITRVDDLISNIKELHQLIGMKKLKEELMNFIQFVVINSINRTSSPSERNLADGHFINMVLSGDPGCGKTTAAKILCKIIGSLNLLKSPPKEKKKEGIISFETFIEEEVDRQLLRKRRKVIDDLQSSYKILSDTVGDLKKDAEEFNDYYSFDKRDYRRFSKRISKLRECKYSVKKILDFYRVEEKEEEEPKVKFTVLKRADLVGKYVGHTAIKTQKALQEAMGGVVLIDEAYSLVNRGDSHDPFGEEALTVINETLSQHPDEIVIIFAGYEKMLDETIFKAQPGLKRRIGWTFNVDTYTSEDLKNIFITQTSRYDGWKVEDSPSLSKFFETHIKKFPHFGGDTERLLSLSKQECYSSHFRRIANGEKIKFESIITLNHLNVVISKFEKKESDRLKEEIHNSMYL